MVTYRTTDPDRWGAGKEANLLPAEIDGNFWELLQRIVAIEEEGDASNGIANITVSGSQMTIHLVGGTSLGPYTLPRSVIRWAGEWTAGAALAELDLFVVTGQGVFMALRSHTTEATFSPTATVNGQPAYRQLLPASFAIGDAPSDGKLYGRQDGAWVEIPAAAP